MLLVTLHVDGIDYDVDLHAVTGTEVHALQRDLNVSTLALVAHVEQGTVELTEVVALQVLSLHQHLEPADVGQLLAAVTLGSVVSITTPDVPANVPDDAPADAPIPPDLLAAAVAQLRGEMADT